MDEDLIKLLGTPFTLQTPKQTRTKSKFFVDRDFSNANLEWNKNYEGYLFDDSIYISVFNGYSCHQLYQYTTSQFKDKMFTYGTPKIQDPDLHAVLMRLSYKINNLENRLDNI